MNAVFKNNLLKSIKFGLIFTIIPPFIFLFSKIFLFGFGNQILKPITIFLITPVIFIAKDFSLNLNNAGPVDLDSYTTLLIANFAFLGIFYVIFYTTIFFVIISIANFLKNVRLKQNVA